VKVGTTANRLLTSLGIGAALVVVGCGGSGVVAPPSVRLAGVALDATSHQPIGGVQIQAGTKTATTAVDGTFVLTGLSPHESVSLVACAFQPTNVIAPSKSGKLTVRLTELPVTGTVVSNLTHTGLAADVTEATVTTTGKTDGTFSIQGPCPNGILSLSSAGYAAGTVTVGDTRKVTATLLADPATTVLQEVAWETVQNWAAECVLIEPDTLAYTSVKACIALLANEARQGYQNVSEVVHSVTYTTWTFPRCSHARFGPKTYAHVASINYTLQQTTPGGGVTAINGIQHMVQTADGFWRWFPLSSNCT